MILLRLILFPFTFTYYFVLFTLHFLVFLVGMSGYLIVGMPAGQDFTLKLKFAGNAGTGFFGR